VIEELHEFNCNANLSELFDTTKVLVCIRG